LTVDTKTGKVLTSPDIISRGFVYMREAEDLINKTRQEALKSLELRNKNYPVNWTFIKNKIRDDIGEFLYKQTQRRPMVIPVIIEV
jgi:ribonuclease J